MNTRILSLAVFSATLTTLSACETARSVNPFAGSSTFQSHCRRALDALAATDADKQSIRVEDVSQRERLDLARPAQAVTIVYVQGDSRRLMTCLYEPDNPQSATGISYRSETIARARLDQVNAAVAKR